MVSKEQVESRNFSGVFYAPKLVEVFPLVDDILNKEYDSISKKINGYSSSQVVAEIIRLYYSEYVSNCSLTQESEYVAQGKFNLESLTKCVEQSLGILNMVRFFDTPITFGLSSDKKSNLNYVSVYKEVECSCEDERVFAVGRLMKDTETSDTDPYMTAGGHRSFLSKEGEPVYFNMGLNGVYLSFKGSCMVDHYNNNIGGNSTGGGTTKYAYGERVETRVIQTNLYDVKDVMKKFDVSLEKMDSNKGKSIMDELTQVNVELIK